MHKFYISTTNLTQLLCSPVPLCEKTTIVFKHRHQICKAPSLCKTFFITSNCRLKEAGQKKYLTASFSQHLSHTVFLTLSFSLCLSHNVFLTTSYSQRLSHNIFLTLLPLYIHPHNVVLKT